MPTPSHAGQLSLIQIVDRLLPASKRWLAHKGYIEQSDGGIQLTPAGYAYFIRIMHHG